MKKEYKKPLAEVIQFVPDNCIMDNNAGIEPGASGSVEDWEE